MQKGPAFRFGRAVLLSFHAHDPSALFGKSPILLRLCTNRVAPVYVFRYILKAFCHSGLVCWVLCEIPTEKLPWKKEATSYPCCPGEWILVSRQQSCLLSASDRAQIRPLKDSPDLEEFAHGPLAAQTILLFQQGPESDQATDHMQASQPAPSQCKFWLGVLSDRVYTACFAT